MSTENPGVYFDASCSWNGYNHQGKLALWYALKKIEEIYDCVLSESDNCDSLSRYFLEIEYLEDFSFGKYNANNDADYLFVHQVKNHENTNASDYDSALLGLACHVSERPNIQKAYLHTTKKVLWGQQTLLDYIKQLVSNPVNLYSILNQIALTRNSTEEKEALLIPKRGRPSDFKKKLMEAYAESIGQERIKIDKNNIGLALDALEIKTQKAIATSQAMTDEQLLKIEEYPYEVNGNLQSYCQVDQIENLLKSEIKTLVVKLPACKPYWNTDEFIQKRYLYLLGKLDQHIIERNINYPLYKSGKKERKISLKTIYEWIVDQIIDELPDEFFLFYIKEAFYDSVNRYCDSNRCKRKESCSSCAVHSCIDKISIMTFDEMRTFLYFTNPTVSAKMSMTTYSQYTGENGIRNPFIRGLSSIALEFEEDKTAITYKDNQTLSHVLTTIISDDDGFDAPDICLDILKNRQLYELMMDCDYFISRNLDVSSVQAEGMKVGYIFDEKDANHIARFKNVKIEKVDSFAASITEGN